MEFSDVWIVGGVVSKYTDQFCTLLEYPDASVARSTIEEAPLPEGDID